MTDSQSKPIMKLCSNGGQFKPESDFIGAKGQLVKACKGCRDAKKKSKAKMKTKKPPPGEKLCSNGIHYAKIELFEGDHKCCTPCLKNKNEDRDLRITLAQEQAKKEGKRYCGRCYKTKELEEFRGKNCHCEKCNTYCAAKKKERYEMNLRELKEGNEVCTYCGNQHPLDHFVGAYGGPNGASSQTKQCQGCRDKASTYESKRYNENEKYKIMCLLRANMKRVFNGEMKDERTMEMIGCDLDNLLNWLYFQLEERYGITEKDEDTEYHQDHFKPVNSFNLKDPEERKKCCHWTNFQWLTKKDNLKKSDTMPTDAEIKRRKELIDDFII